MALGIVGALGSPARASSPAAPEPAAVSVHAGQADAGTLACWDGVAWAGLLQQAGYAYLIYCDSDTSFVLEVCDTKPDGWGVRGLIGNRNNPDGSRTLYHLDHRSGAGECTVATGYLNQIPSALAISACVVKGDAQKDCNRTILY